MIVLGIDPGTNFGWSVDTAFTGNWDHHESGFVELPEEPTERMVEFLWHFRTILKKYRPSVVAVEMVHAKSTAQAKIIYGQLGIVRGLARAYGYAVLEVPASQWKKEIIGKGNASKEETMAALGAKINEHEADAIGVRHFVHKVGVKS